MKIAIVGMGYIGLFNGIPLAQNNEVVCLDLVTKKVVMLNRKESLIEAVEIEDFLKNRPLNVRATLDKQGAYVGVNYVISVTSTDCDPETNYFKTESIKAVVRDIMSVNPQAVMFIKSTVSVGYPNKTWHAIGTDNLMFSLDVIASVAHGDIQFIAVGTPLGANAVQYALTVVRDMGRHMTGFKLASKSTTPLGVGEKVLATIAQKLAVGNMRELPEFPVMSNPEFLKESSAGEDFMRLDRIIIGAQMTPRHKIGVRVNTWGTCTTPSRTGWRCSGHRHRVEDLSKPRFRCHEVGSARASYLR